jgi:hypothetical protein
MPRSSPVLANTEARAQVLLALTSPNDEEVQIAQVYFRHQPVADVNELRIVTSGIARMNGATALAGKVIVDRTSQTASSPC